MAHDPQQLKDPQALQREIEHRRDVVGRDLEAIGDHVLPSRVARRTRRRMRNRWHDVRDRLLGTVDSVERSAGDAASGAVAGIHHGAQQVGEGVGQLSQQVAGAPEAVRRRTQGSPLTVGFVAFGIGLLAAALLPETEIEQDLAEQAAPTLGGAVSRVQELAHEAADHVVADLRDPARDALDEVRTEAGQAVAEVADEARAHGHQVADHLTS